MKQLFYYLSISLLLLSSAIKASDPLDEDSVKRGLSIYQTINRTWFDTREEIAKEGLTPFLSILTYPMCLKPSPESKRKAREKLAMAYIAAEEIDITSVISAQATFNQEAYHRSSVFSAINILEDKAFFKALDRAYPDAQSLILDVLRYHLKDHESLFSMTYSFCEIVNPSLKSFLKRAIFNTSSRKEDSSLYNIAIGVLWYEPRQILAHALNAYLEDLLAKTRSSTMIHPTISLGADINNNNAIQLFDNRTGSEMIPSQYRMSSITFSEQFEMAQQNQFWVNHTFVYPHHVLYLAPASTHQHHSGTVFPVTLPTYLSNSLPGRAVLCLTPLSAEAQQQ